MKFELDNVELSFDAKRILYGVYLKAEKGKVTGILGSNGCGKTSLLRIFFGNLKCNNKLVRIDNKGKLKPLYATGMVKFLSQTDFLPKQMKVKDIFSISRLSFDDFIKSFPSMEILRNQKVKKFSGGERRILSIWLTLKSPSELVLLDEPFTHLSPIYIEKIKEEILKEKLKKAIVVTDHLYKDIMNISDDLYLLKDGCCKPIRDISELENSGYVRMGRTADF